MTTVRATATASLGPAAVGSLLWQSSGQLYVTAIVKARFVFEHGKAMNLAAPAPLADKDEHLGGDPTCSLRVASDAVPFRERADVWLHGHAQAPGPPVSASVARLAIYRGRNVLLDKLVHVVGDRRGDDQAPQPFHRMPIIWERAYGGIGHEENPVGVGADERDLWPNVLDPESPERPAGFAPISRYWKLRRRCLGDLDRRDLERGILDIPQGFDWGYFQAAPWDQRLDFLRGDEWVVLDGMTSERVRVQSRLPKVRGVARLMPREPRLGDDGEPIAMVADTIDIDADVLACSVTWRGSARVTRRQVEDSLVAGTVMRGEREVAWARAYDAMVPPDGSSPAGSTVLDESTVTTVDDAPEQNFGQTIVDTEEPSLQSLEEITGTVRIGAAVDTEPGVPPVDEDDLAWVKEPAEEPVVEPAPDTDRSPPTPRISSDAPPRSQPRLSSLPPAPLDREAYTRALREAGATEEEIAALLRSLADSGVE